MEISWAILLFLAEMIASSEHAKNPFAITRKNIKIKSSQIDNTPPVRFIGKQQDLYRSFSFIFHN
jgi:hypothetical protein